MADTMGVEAGAAYLFDGSTGGWLHSFYSPEADSSYAGFGSVASVGENILVGAPGGGWSQTPGAAYLFDGTSPTHDHLRSFYSPEGPTSYDWFGIDFANLKMTHLHVKR